MEYARIFYDTNALLTLQEQAFQRKFCIAQQTLEEIENIKTSGNKDNEIKFKARHLAHLLNDHYGDYDVILYNDELIGGWIRQFKLKETPDNIICASAFQYWCNLCNSKEYDNENDNFVFCTDDLNCSVIAREVFCMLTFGTQELDFIKNVEEYKGWKDVTLSDEEMSYFYSNMDKNIYDLLVNEYLIIRKSDGEVVDRLRWDGENYQQVTRKNIKSMYFDKLKPKDEYQLCLIDALMTLPIVCTTGKPGSGKSLLSLMVAMHLIETGKYDRLVVLFNPTKARGAADMGFYPNDAYSKAMSNSIGNILISKIGDRYGCDLLLQQNKLKLVSMADCRGMEIADNEILWITEAQNTSVDLMKLCLSRVSSGAKIMLEGDPLTQVDSFAFEGNNNGLARVIKMLCGEKEFGYIQLQNVWRSKIAQLVDKL